MLDSLILPYTQSITSGVSLAKVQFTDHDDSTRIILECNSNKSVSSLTVSPPSDDNKALEYITNPTPMDISDSDERSLRFNKTTPLMIKVPFQYCKLKLSVTFTHVPKEMDSKSLLIVKSPGWQSRRSACPTASSPGVEVSRLAYSQLPLDTESPDQRITINDTFSGTGFVNVSLWEYDVSTDSYSFLFDFGFYYDEARSAPLSEPPTPTSPPAIIPKETNVKEVRLSVDSYKRELAFVLEDGPEFRSKVIRYENNFGQYKRTLLSIHEELKQMDGYIKKLSQCRQKITDYLSHAVDAQGSSLLRQLSFVSEFDTRSKQVFDRSERNLRFFINEVLDVPKLRKMCQAVSANSFSGSDLPPESNELYTKKKRFESNSKEYYSWLNKYLSNEKERPESKLLAKRKLFELSKFDYMNQLDLVTNNQYANSWFEGLFKFTQLGYDPANPRLLNYSQFRDQKSDEMPEKYVVYLYALSMFNSEKAKFRQLIEASQSNEELTQVLKYNQLNPNNGESNGEIITRGNLNLIYDQAAVFNSKPAIDATADMSSILYALGGQGKPGWHKEWVVLRNGLLSEYSDWRKGSKPINTPIAVALASIKPTTYEKRQNCFAIHTSTGNKHIFQAINADERNKWIKALYQAGQVVDIKQMPAIPSKIKSKRHSRPLSRIVTDLNAGNGPVSPVSITSQRMDKFDDNRQLVRNKALAGNHVCADCGSVEQVEWVSINFLTCICVECASCHRNLGSHISKVRSLKLDKFEGECQYLLTYINNDFANSFLEFTAPAKPTHASNHKQRLDYIRAKYEEKRFKEPIHHVDNLLIQSVQRIDIPNVLRAISCGGNLSIQLQIKVQQGGQQNQQVISLFEYSLRKFVLAENESRMFCISELMILNGCMIDAINYNMDIGLSDEALEYWRVRKNKLL